MIALGIVGVVAALILPMANKFKPDQNKITYLKTYDSLVETVKAAASNKKIYPVMNSNEIREECYVIPQKLMMIQVVLLSIMLAVLFNIVKMSLLLFAKFLLIYFSFFTAAWVISILLIKKDLNQVIDLTFDRFSEYEEPKETTKFYKTLITNLLPLFIVVIVGVTLFGYASTTTQRGEGIYNYYKQRNE